LGRKQQKKPRQHPNSQKRRAQATPVAVERQHLWFAIIIAAIAFLCYVNTLGHGYALDDKAVITQNRFTQQGVEGIPELVTNGHFFGYNNAKSGLYRPIPLITHAVEYELFGETPSVSHFLNVLFYTGLCVVLFFLLAKWLKGYSVLLPFTAALLYTVHPLHTELVANIKGRDEILVFLFLLTTLWGVYRYVAEERQWKWIVFSLLAYALALFTKENALTFLAIIPLTLFVFARSSIKQAAIATLPFLAVAVVYLLIRSQFVEPVEEYRFFDSYFQYAPDKSDRIATAVGNFAQHLRLLIFPYPLVYDYSYNQIPVISWAHPQAILSLLGVLGLISYGIYQLPRRAVVSFAILFYFITIAVTANIITPTSAVFAERFLFIPSLGFCLLLAYGAYKLMTTEQATDWQKLLSPTSNRLILGLLAVIVLAGAGRTLHRNQAWQNDLMLFQNDLAYTPNNARTHFNLGRYYILNTDQMANKQQAIERGVALLRQAVGIDPRFTNAHQLLAAGYDQLGQTGRAITHLRKYTRLAQRGNKHPAKIARAFRDLGDLYDRQGKGDSMQIAYQQAIDVAPDQFQNYFNYANKLFNQGLYEEAVQQYQKALQINPDSYDCYYNIAAAQVNLGRHKKAGQNLQQALKLRPGDEQAKQLLNRIEERGGN
jgi:tetratricopeptide (TPR) repeat protein